MNGLAIGLVVAACVFAGGVAGTLLDRVLPPEHLSNDSRDVVMLGTGMLSVLASLVLGLLIATAKSAYDTKDADMRSFATDIVSLDETLRQYDDGALSARRALRDYATTLLDDVWLNRHPHPDLVASPEALGLLERAQGEIRTLKAANDDQRRLVDEAVAAGATLQRRRWLLIEEAGPSVRVAVIVILICWITAIFVSFGMRAPRNPTVYASFLVCALAMGSAFFLIVELDRPFEGVLRISSRPVTNAIANILPAGR
jgi:hypothetical protein